MCSSDLLGSVEGFWLRRGTSGGGAEKRRRASVQRRRRGGEAEEEEVEKRRRRRQREEARTREKRKLGQRNQKLISEEIRNRKYLFLISPQFLFLE